MTESPDINGTWEGSFEYSSSLDVGEFPFKARLKNSDGTISGIILEDHVSGSGQVKSTVEGQCNGREMRFTKQYLDSSEEYKTLVQYEGEISASGDVISGKWILPHDSGTFSMAKVV
ncbi:hypothetical protein ACRAQ7_07920 [Erythrobacter sp. W53]|uniref:hypothetical protein n=1 Tax=Erythrobacteraceae TaxID=335929 RepID=UPI0036D2EA8B